MNMDGFVGYAIVAYQLSRVAINRCEAGKVPLSRFERRFSLGHEAKKEFCPRCATPSHTAAPPSYEVGPFDSLKARGAA